MSTISVISGELITVIFNSLTLSDYDFYCYDVIKPLMPRQEETTVSIHKVSGYKQILKKFPSNALTLKGYVKETSYANLKTALDSLKAILYYDTDKILTLSNETGKYWNCQYLDGYPVGERDNYTLIDLIFNCNDPFAYDTTPDTDSQAGITTIGGTWTVNNGGHHYCFPTITITFNQSQSHIYIANNGISGNRFDISKAYESGDELEVNCKDGTVKLNGSLSPSGFGDGGDESAEWILFATGNNEMEVGTDDVSIDIDVDMSWEKVYFS